MSNSKRAIRMGRNAADILERSGYAKEAEDVRSLCRSLVTASITLSQLHKDNMELRKGSGT